ncbi:type IV secretion system protein, partial [Escherichia coli]
MAADGNCSGHGANGPGCFVCPGVDCGQPVAVARIAWILLYAGVFFLGFGGSRWTSDMAINYYKTVLGLAA